MRPRISLTGSVRPSVGWLVGWLIGDAFVKNNENQCFWPFKCCRRRTELTSYIGAALLDGLSVSRSVCPPQFCKIQWKLDVINKSKTEKAKESMPWIKPSCNHFIKHDASLALWALFRYISGYLPLKINFPVIIVWTHVFRRLPISEAPTETLVGWGPTPASWPTSASWQLPGAQPKFRP